MTFLAGLNQVCGRQAGIIRLKQRPHGNSVHNGTLQDLASSCPRCPKDLEHPSPPTDPTTTTGHATNAKNNTCPGTDEVCPCPQGNQPS